MAGGVERTIVYQTWRAAGARRSQGSCFLPTGRRMARELALKTIFQVDVGKQPLSEVIEGALDQLRQAIRTAVAENGMESSARLLEQTIPSEPNISTQSKRQLRGISRAIVGELQALQGMAGVRCREAISETGHFDAEKAAGDFEEDCGRAAKSIEAQASKPSLYPAHVDYLMNLALDSIPRMLEQFQNAIGPATLTGRYAVKLALGATEKQDEIDRRVEELSSGWALERQAAVDRNILRLAAYELLYQDDVPIGAAINEAVELAQKYSTEESGRFVNGVLGALAAARAPDRALSES